MPTARSNTAVYTRVFLLSSDRPPWPCYFCGDPVRELGRPKGVIHHVDHDPKNNDPENLVAAHWNCHISYHLHERTPSQAALDALARGQAHSPSLAEREHLAEINLKLSASERELLEADWCSGYYKLAELAQKYRISKATVRRYLQNAPPRTRRCGKGHLMDEANLYRYGDGKEKCLTCNRSSALNYYYNSGRSATVKMKRSETKHRRT